MFLRSRLWFCWIAVAGFCANSSSAQVSPFEFIQRNDVGREINVQPAQLETVQRLQPICDAQCQARIMEMLTSIDVNLQTQFLAQTIDDQQQTVRSLDQNARESIEMDMLSEAVLSPEQMTRLEQLRTQFLGLDSFLSERVSQLAGMSPIQINQLNEIQNVGSDLINACRQDSSLASEQQQAQIQNIQNVLIDQSVNVLNDAQIEIFINLCGEECNFDPPTEPVAPDNNQPDNPTGAENQDDPAGAEPESNEPNPAAAITNETSNNRVPRAVSGPNAGTVPPQQDGSTTRT